VKGTTFALVEAFESESGHAAPDARNGRPGQHPREPILLPVHWGKRGHPIVIGRSVFPEIARLGYDEPLRAVVLRVPERV
jgi:CTP:molybdopterin cytidylyltransferase MocA